MLPSEVSARLVVAEDLGLALFLDQTGSYVVSYVLSDSSAAEQEKIQPGDIVREIDGVSLHRKTVAEVKFMLIATKPGSTVSMHGPTQFRCSASTTSARSAEEALLSLLASSGAKGRGAALTAEQEADVHRLATELEESAPTGDDTNTSPLLPGRWRVLYQGKPGGEKTEFFSAESWKKYLSGDGM
jgi:hypothetical protein